MRQQRPGARAEKASGASARCLLFLCAAGLLLSSCGDFTLFPEGFGPGPTPEPEGFECENPFPTTMDIYQQSGGTFDRSLDTTIKEPAAVAVLPPGMRFTFSPEGTTGEITAKAGDVLVADTNSIYFYPEGRAESRVVFPADAVTLGGGLALHVEEVTLLGEKQKIQILLYTGISNTGVSNLFLQHLSESSVPSTVLKIPEGTPGLPGLTAFQDAGAIAVGHDGTRLGVFVADARPPELDGHSVFRINLQISVQTGRAMPDGMTWLAYLFREIRDIGFSHETGALYLTEFAESNATVHRVASALTWPRRVMKSDQTRFVEASRLIRSTGLVLVPTNRSGTTDALLVLSQESDRALQRFDVNDMQRAPVPLNVRPTPNTFVRQAVAYDCETARIFITHRLNQPGVGQHTPGLYFLARNE